MPNLPDLPPLPEPLLQALANAVSVSSLALGNLPEPIRQRMLDDAERIKIEEAAASIKRMMAGGTQSLEMHCLRDGHRLIPDTDDLFVCHICAKRFRLVD